jgi:hypothetical protein
MKKKVKPIMLPTDGASHLFIDINKGRNTLIYRIFGGVKPQEKNKGNSPQHLYFLSDEEIKEGDWYIVGDRVLTAVIMPISSKYRKIIATTDKSLGIMESVDFTDRDVKVVLPWIPESFVKHFVEANGGIDEVMVEYKRMYKTERGSTFEARDGECPTFNHTKEWQELKTTEDNEVIIHLPEEKMYSKEEVGNKGRYFMYSLIDYIFSTPQEELTELKKHKAFERAGELYKNFIEKN